MDLCRIFFFVRHGRRWGLVDSIRNKGRFGMTHIELPSLNVLAGIFVGDDDDELGDFAANHPLVELAHDFLDIGFDLVVGRD